MREEMTKSPSAIPRNICSWARDSLIIKMETSHTIAVQKMGLLTRFLGSISKCLTTSGILIGLRRVEELILTMVGSFLISLEGAARVGLLRSMNKGPLPPHLKVAKTVTEEEYLRARWQRLVTLSFAMIAGVSVAFFGMIFSNQGRNWFAPGIALAIGLERLLNVVLKDGHKMATQRMKVYPELRDFRERNGL